MTQPATGASDEQAQTTPPTLVGASDAEREAIQTIEKHATAINTLLRNGLAEKVATHLLEPITRYLPQDRPLLTNDKVNAAFWSMGESAGALENISRYQSFDAAKEVIRKNVANIGHRFEPDKPTGVLQKLNTVLNVHAGVARETSPLAEQEAEKLYAIMNAVEGINNAAYQTLGIEESRGNRIPLQSTGAGGVGGR